MNEQDALKQSLGLEFIDEALLEQALTHPSVAAKPHYQRLEFLGDRVLGLAIADWLYNRYSDEPEGQLNRRLSGLVRTESLADIGEHIGLPQHIIMEAGAIKEGANQKPTVLADVVEAIIGATFLDQGFAAAKDLVQHLFAQRLEADPTAAKDAKTRLQEWAQQRGLGLPDYEIVARTGPDHAPCFTVEVKVAGRPPVRAQGPAKRQAEQAAANKLIEELTGAGA